MGGLSVEMDGARDMGAAVRLHFLVQEGRIRAHAVVRHVKPGRGLGFKFTALSAPDGPRLTALIARLRSLPRSRTNSK
jgi:hypothetical protein